MRRSEMIGAGFFFFFFFFFGGPLRSMVLGRLTPLVYMPFTSFLRLSFHEGTMRCFASHEMGSRSNMGASACLYLDCH